MDTEKLFNDVVRVVRESSEEQIRLSEQWLAEHPVPLQSVYLLWMNDAVLGVYKDRDEAERVAGLLISGDTTRWIHFGPNEWRGWIGKNMVATMKIDARRIG